MTSILIHQLFVFGSTFGEQTPGYTTYGNGTVYARINGTVYSVGIGTGQKITSSAIRLGTWDVTVGHNSDGSKAIGVSGWLVMIDSVQVKMDIHILNHYSSTSQYNRFTNNFQRY